MIRVKLLGMFGVNADAPILDLPVLEYDEIVASILKENPKLDKNSLKKALIFVNDKSVTRPNKLSYKSGDVITFMNPSGGG